MTRFEEYCQRGRARWGDKFVPPTGTEFINAYNSGTDFRIKVRTKYVTEVYERWGFVGITTGWAPVFLLMHSVRARGSSDTLNPDRDKIVECKMVSRRR